MSDWGIEWELPEYPQLPKLFTSAKTAKKRKHREFIVTEELLEQPVKLSKLPGTASKTAKATPQQQAAATAADNTSTRKPSKEDALHHHHHQQQQQATVRQPTQAADGGQPASSSKQEAKEAKLKDKYNYAMILEATQEQHSQQQQQHEPSRVHADEQQQQQQNQPQGKTGRKEKRHNSQHQLLNGDSKAEDVAAGAGLDGPAAQQQHKKSKNKFKLPDFLAQQQQQQQVQPVQVPAKQRQHQQQTSQQEAKEFAAQLTHQPAAAAAAAAPTATPAATPKHKKQKKDKQHVQQPKSVATQPVPAPAAAKPSATGNSGGSKLLQQFKDRLAGSRFRQVNEAPKSASTQPVPAPAAKPSAAGSSGGSKLLQQFKDRLAGSRFRQLNEALYTQPGGDSFTQMQQQPGLFTQYHEGFQQQVKSWPTQPLDVAINWLKDKPADYVVVDYGCGEARLAATVKQTVRSLDLVAAAPSVIACNMAQSPLAAVSCDAAVFSLALMGTDYGEFLLDAARVLKEGGWLWIAEVRSRFAGGNGSEDFRPFLSSLQQLGFKLIKQDAKNRMFVVFVLKKQQAVDAEAADSIRWPPLKACVYKKR